MNSSVIALFIVHAQLTKQYTVINDNYKDGETFVEANSPRAQWHFTVHNAMCKGCTGHNQKHCVTLSSIKVFLY